MDNADDIQPRPPPEPSTPTKSSRNTSPLGEETPRLLHDRTPRRIIPLNLLSWFPQLPFYPRWVPELALMAKRVVKAEAKRRARRVLVVFGDRDGAVTRRRDTQAVLPCFVCFLGCAESAAAAGWRKLRAGGGVRDVGRYEIAWVGASRFACGWHFFHASYAFNCPLVPARLEVPFQCHAMRGCRLASSDRGRKEGTLVTSDLASDYSIGLLRLCARFRPTRAHDIERIHLGVRGAFPALPTLCMYTVDLERASPGPSTPKTGRPARAPGCPTAPRTTTAASSLAILFSSTPPHSLASATSKVPFASSHADRRLIMRALSLPERTLSTSPPWPIPPTSPNVFSKLPRFLQSTAQRDHSKSLNLGPDHLPSSASSHSNSNSHTSHASHNTSNSTSTSSSGGNRRRFLGPGKGEKEKEKDVALRQREQERQRLERGACGPLTLHESGLGSPTEYDFSASTPPSSASSNSHSHSGHGHAGAHCFL
ncbi:hypothetical protein C8R43DRAFT_1118311 [Mycena crocata]|nr:hypothetical protein C8R43DRAFT_1118311 [Mycena crocata]